MVLFITDGKVVFLFYATQLPCRSQVIILSTSSYHRSDVIYVCHTPGCMPVCLAIGATLKFLLIFTGFLWFLTEELVSGEQSSERASRGLERSVHVDLHTLAEACRESLHDSLLRFVWGNYYFFIAVIIFIIICCVYTF